MFRRIFVLSYVIISVTHLQALSNEIPVKLDGISSSASLSIVFGWFHNDKDDKWVSRNKEIKDIDSFNNYYILSFHENDKKYVAIVKERKEGKFLIFDTYIIDYHLYESRITLWEEDALIKFPILKHHQSKIKKEQHLTKEILGIEDLSGLLTNPRDYFVFQYKFFEDSTVKFLLYVEECSLDSCILSGLNTKQGLEKLYINIGHDKLYSSFFYKTTIKYFVDFIDSPLNKS